MQGFNWNKEYKAMVGGSGELLMTDPNTGLAWENAKQARRWFDTEKKRQQQELNINATAEKVTKEPASKHSNKVFKAGPEPAAAQVQKSTSTKPKTSQKKWPGNKAGKPAASNQAQKQSKAN